MSLLNGLRRAVAGIMAVFLMVFVTPNKAPAHTVLDEENCKMCITAMSDVHIEGNNFATYKGFGRVLLDAKNNSFGTDVGVFLGDDTMNGQEIESLLFYGLLAENSFAKNYISAPGNHDVGNGEGNYDILFKRFADYSKTFLKVNVDKPYYCKVIDGVYFMVLGTEKLCVNEVDPSDEQYAFLVDSLEKAKADNAISFICCHHPEHDINDSENYSFWNIVKNYKNVFFISGHTHMPVTDWWTFDKYLGVNIINLPKCTENVDEKSENSNGCGVQIEIYENEVVARIRDFYNGKWVEGFERHYAIQK